MKRVATSLLAAAALVFTVSFALQDSVPWLAYVRAAAEGAMVGALADWFAVTALFRYPLGLRIPHTAIIPTRKDEIGATLGAFVEDEFLSDEVVVGKLRSIGISRRLGGWLATPANADRLTAEASVAARGVMTLLGDDDVEDVIEKLARRHLFEPEWGPAIGRMGERLVAADQQRAAVDALFEKAEEWLEAHPEAIGGHGLGAVAAVDARLRRSGSSTSGRTRRCSGSSARCARIPPIRCARRSTATSPTSRTTCSTTRS